MNGEEKGIKHRSKNPEVNITYSVGIEVRFSLDFRMFWLFLLFGMFPDDGNKTEKEKRSGKNHLSMDLLLLYSYISIRYHRADDLISQ